MRIDDVAFKACPKLSIIIVDNETEIARVRDLLPAEDDLDHLTFITQAVYQKQIKQVEDIIAHEIAVREIKPALGGGALPNIPINLMMSFLDSKSRASAYVAIPQAGRLFSVLNRIPKPGLVSDPESAEHKSSVKAYQEAIQEAAYSAAHTDMKEEKSEPRTVVSAGAVAGAITPQLSRGVVTRGGAGGPENDMERSEERAWQDRCVIS